MITEVAELVVDVGLGVILLSKGVVCHCYPPTSPGLWLQGTAMRMYVSCSAG